MIPCNNFIVPIFEADECLGERKPASCVIDSSIYTELSLPTNSSQQEINQALYLSAIASKSTTDSLQTQIDLIPTGDTLQDLQSVLNVGSYGSIGSSFIAINDDSIAIQTASTSNTNNYARISTKWVDNIISTPQMEIQVNLNTTRLEFETPTVFSEIKVPAPLTAGIYTLLVCSNISYTVSNLPLGVLNNVAVVTDATAPTYLGTLVGGGSVVTPVWHNGTIWVSR